MSDPNEPSTKRQDVSLGAVLSAAWSRVPEVSAASVTVIVTTIYVLGFVIANTYYGSLAPTSFGLLEGRYVAAGLLFALFSVGPLASGVFFGEAVFRGTAWGNPRFPRKTRINAALIGLSLLTVWLFALLLIVPFMGAPGARWWMPYTVYAAICLLVTCLLASSHWSFEGRGGTFSIMTIAGMCFFPIVLSTYFAVTVYPEISPRFGGGGGWIARISHPIAGVTLPPDDSTILILLTGDGSISAISCPNRRGGADAERWLLPASELGPVLIEGQSSTSAFLGRDRRGRSCYPRDAPD